MKLGDYITAVVADLKANATFLKEVESHGKVFGIEELRNLVVMAPACRIALIGSRVGGTSISMGASRAGMGRADTGQFRGPLLMVAFLIEQDWELEEARDRVIRLTDDFMTYLEHKTFGLTEAGPALISGFDIMYSAEVDAQGAAIAAVTWEQEVAFGRDIHAEDMALLTGDKYGHYPSGQVFYSEGEWADKGQLNRDEPPIVESTVTPLDGVPLPDMPQPTEMPPTGIEQFEEETGHPAKHPKQPNVQPDRFPDQRDE